MKKEIIEETVEETVATEVVVIDGVEKIAITNADGIVSYSNL